MSPPPPTEPLPAPPRSGLRGTAHDLTFLAVLAVIAFGIGVVVNQFRILSLPLAYFSKTARLQQSVTRLGAAHPTLATPSPALSAAQPPFPASTPEMIDLARFHDLTQSGAVVLDARPELFYRVGHVPGARSLSRAAFETDYARLRASLELRRRETVVVYCAGDECEDSHMVASALQKLGYTEVLIFAGGWEEWQRAGLPEERS